MALLSNPNGNVQRIFKSVMYRNCQHYYVVLIVACIEFIIQKCIYRLHSQKFPAALVAGGDVILYAQYGCHISAMVFDVVCIGKAKLLLQAFGYIWLPCICMCVCIYNIRWYSWWSLYIVCMFKFYVVETQWWKLTMFLSFYIWRPFII